MPPPRPSWSRTPLTCFWTTLCCAITRASLDMWSRWPIRSMCACGTAISPAGGGGPTMWTTRAASGLPASATDARSTSMARRLTATARCCLRVARQASWSSAAGSTMRCPTPAAGIIRTRTGRRRSSLPAAGLAPSFAGTTSPAPTITAGTTPSRVPGATSRRPAD